MLSGNLPGRRFQWANFSANRGGYLIFLGRNDVAPLAQYVSRKRILRMKMSAVLPEELLQCIAPPPPLGGGDCARLNKVLPVLHVGAFSFISISCSGSDLGVTVVRV